MRYSKPLVALPLLTFTACFMHPATGLAGADENLDLGTPDYPHISAALSADFARAHPIYDHNMRDGELHLTNEGKNNLTPQQWADLVPEQIACITAACPNCQSSTWLFDFTDPDHIACTTCSEVFPDNPAFPEQSKTMKTPWGTDTTIRYHEDGAGNVYHLRGQLDTSRFNEMKNSYYDLARAWYQNKETDPAKAAFYAERVQAVLLEYAKVYPTYLPVNKKENIYYDTGAPFVQDGQTVPDWKSAYPHSGSLWVRWPWTSSIPNELAEVYDICYASPGMDAEVPGYGKTLRSLIEERIFDTAVNYLQAYQWTFHIRGNTQTHYRKILELARICGRPDYARFVVDTVDYAQTHYDTGWDLFSTEGIGYHNLWANNPTWAAYELAYYADPIGYVDENGKRIDPFDPRTMPNLQRMSWNWRTLLMPDGIRTPVHDYRYASFQTPERARVDESKTRMLSAFGEGILADGSGDRQVEAHLHWSGGHNHAHKDMLQILLWGHGRILADDALLDENQHSTVYVDGGASNLDSLSHDNRGNLEWYTPNFKGISIVRTDGTPGMQSDYGDIQADFYRRTLALNTQDPDHPYVLDIFEVDGGKTHDYRLIGSSSHLQNFSTDYTTAAAPSFTDLSLTDAETCVLDRSGYVEMTFDDDPAVGTRSWFTRDDSAELVLARGAALHVDNGNTSQIVLRRNDPAGDLESTFIVIHEMRNGPSAIQSVTNEWLSADTLGVAVQATNGRTDYYLLSLGGRTNMSYGPVTAHAQCAMASIQGGNTDLWMVGGTAVSANGKTLARPVPEYTGTVSDPTRRQTGDSQDSFLTDAGLPLGEELAGEAALLEYCDAAGNTLFVNPFTILKVEDAGAKQRVVVSEDVAFSIDAGKVTEGFKDWREADHIRLRVVKNSSTIPLPKLVGDDLFFPLEFTPDVTPADGQNFAWTTTGNESDTLLSIHGGTFAPATSASTSLAPGHNAATIRITEENRNGIYPPVTNEYSVLSSFPAQSVGTALRDGIWISEYSGSHPADTGIITSVNNWGSRSVLRNVPRLSNPLTQTTSGIIKSDGYLDVPATGLYTLYFHSGGGRFWVDGTLVVDAALMKYSHLYIPVQLHLEQGLHKLDTESFKGHDTNELSLDWEGPGIARQTIPARFFKSVVDPANPGSPVTHTLGIACGANGSVEPTNTVALAEGASQTFTFVSDYGYRVADVVVDGEQVGTPVSYTFTDVAADHAISVTFEPTVDTKAPIVSEWNLPDSTPWGDPVNLGVRVDDDWAASDDVTIAWDLDLDGEFDDGAGTNATWIYWKSSIGTEQVSVKLADPAGNEQVFGTSLSVTPRESTIGEEAAAFTVIGATPGGTPGILAGFENAQTKIREVIHTDSQQFAVGQSFKLPELPTGDTYVLTNLYMQSGSSENFDNYSSGIQLKVFAGSGGQAIPVAHYSYDLPAMGGGSSAAEVSTGDWVQFSLGDGLALDAGGTYSFLLFFPDSSGANGIHKWAFRRDNGGNSYTDGEQFENTSYVASDWSDNPWNNVAAVASADFMFHISGSIAVGTFDSDGDGLTDAQENALGTDPDNPDSVFEITGTTPLPMAGKIEITWPGATGVLYRIWESPDLTNWSVARGWTNAVSTPEDTYEFTTAPSNGFFKVEADVQ